MKRAVTVNAATAAQGECVAAVYALIALSTRCGVNGTWRKRAPVASKMALAIAAVTGTIEGSPPPSGCISGRFDQHDLDVRNLLEADDRVAVPIEIFLSRGIEFHFFQERPAHCLQDVSFDLVFQPIGIDDQAAIVPQGNFLYGHLASRFVDFDFRDGRNHGIGPIRHGNASSRNFGPGGRS